MNFGVNLNENSTKLGIFVAVIAVAGLAGWWTGRDLTSLMSLGTFLAGFTGIVVKDK